MRYLHLDESVITNLSISGEKISKKKLRHVWHALYPGRPMPDIIAIRVSKEEFKNFMDILRRHDEKVGAKDFIDFTMKDEWGETVEGSACSCRHGKGYLVLVRLDSPRSLEDELTHELQHIGSGDLDQAGNRYKATKGGEPT